jgi:hypothetical protein
MSEPEVRHMTNLADIPRREDDAVDDAIEFERYCDEVDHAAAVRRLVSHSTMAVDHDILVGVDGTAIVLCCQCGWEWTAFDPASWTDLAAAVLDHRTDPDKEPSE